MASIVIALGARDQKWLRNRQEDFGDHGECAVHRYQKNCWWEDGIHRRCHCLVAILAMHFRRTTTKGVRGGLTHEIPAACLLSDDFNMMRRLQRYPKFIVVFSLYRQRPQPYINPMRCSHLG